MLCVLIGCVGEQRRSGFRWTEVDAETDSLSQRIDRAIFHREPNDSVAAMIAGLGRLVEDRKKDVELNGRYLYFRAFLSLREGNKEEFDSLVSEAFSRVDSASHPYLYHRLLHLADNDTERSHEVYRRLRSRLEYFEKVGDDFMTAAHYNELGNLFKNLWLRSEALEAYAKADSLFELSGFHDSAVFDRLNIARVKAEYGDSLGAVEMLMSLDRDQLVKSRPEVERMVVHNLYTVNNDPALPYRLAAIESPDTSALTKVFIANEELVKGNARVSADYACGAYVKGEEDGDGDAMAWASFAAADAYAAMGRPDSAYQWLRQAVDIMNLVGESNQSEDIVNSDVAREIEQKRLEEELAWNKRMLRLVCICSVIVILLMVAGWITAVRIRRLKSRHEATERERHEMSRRLMATQIAMDESEKLIDSVGKEIGDMAESGRISDGATRPLVNAIKSHAVRREDRGTFIESFATVHPELGRRLRERSEAITDVDVRLASYIVMGMDSKHIASTMGIRPESVKQARWRLRTKLKLKRGENLGNLLRSLVDQPEQ